MNRLLLFLALLPHLCLGSGPALTCWQVSLGCLFTLLGRQKSHLISAFVHGHVWGLVCDLGCSTCRRKVRSQSSDHMDRCKSRGRKCQGREKNQKRQSQQTKVEKSRGTVFFRYFVAPEARKVGSPKQRVRNHFARREMNNCTPLWREASLEVKKPKAPHVQSDCGSGNVANMNAVVARSTRLSQNVQSTRCSEHPWTLRC